MTQTTCPPYPGGNCPLPPPQTTMPPAITTTTTPPLADTGINGGLITAGDVGGTLIIIGLLLALTARKLGRS